MKLTQLKSMIGGAAVGALIARAPDIANIVDRELSYLNHKIATGQLPIPSVHVDSYEKAFYGNGMLEAALIGTIVGVGVGAVGYGISTLLNRRKVRDEKTVTTQQAETTSNPYVQGEIGEPSNVPNVVGTGLREVVLEMARQTTAGLERESRLQQMGFPNREVAQGDLLDRWYQATVYAGAFPTSSSFENFALQLMEKVTSNGGHSGNTHKEWFKDGKISFPINVESSDVVLYSKGKAGIQIDPFGNLTVRINGVTAYQLTQEGYLDLTRRTYAGTGELGRVLDIIEKTIPTFTGEPVGKSLDALVEVKEQRVKI